MAAKPQEPISVPAEEADEDLPMVRFARSGLEARWEPVCGTLLMFARAMGLDPYASCSQGMCGCCAARVLIGKVVYIDEPLHGEPKGKALLCYTVPSLDPAHRLLVLDI